MDARLLEQRAAPALARHLVAAHLGDVRRERQVELGRDVGEDFVAPVGAGRHDRVTGRCGDQRGRPRGRRVRPVELDRAHLAERMRERDRLQRELVVGLDEEQHVHATTQLLQHLDDRGRRLRPMTEHLGLLAHSLRDDEAELLEPRRRPFDGTRIDRLAVRPQLRGHRRVARQIEPLLHRHDGRQGNVVDVASRGDLLLAPRAAVGDRQPFQPCDDRQAEPVGDPDPDLEVARVRRLVAEHDQVERLLEANGVDERRCGRLGVPLLVADEVDRAVCTERHALAQLLLRLRRPERQHDDLATLCLDDAHGLFDAAFLVRRDREAEVLRLDRLLVGRQHHLPAGDRHPLHETQNSHALTLELSGSKTGVESLQATVTG